MDLNFPLGDEGLNTGTAGSGEVGSQELIEPLAGGLSGNGYLNWEG
jgi:hypothetical protein